MTPPRTEDTTAFVASLIAAFCLGIVVGVVGFALTTFILWGGTN